MSESSQEKVKTRRSQRLLNKATAVTAEAKYPSDPSVENIPSVRPRKSVRSPSRTESLPSGLVKSKVRTTPVPQSKQSESYPSSEIRSYPSSEVRSYPSSELRSYPSSEIRSYPSSEVRSYPSSEVRSYPSSEVRSYPSSEVRSYPSSEVRSYPSSEVRSYPSSEVRSYPSSEARSYPSGEVIKSESESYKVEESESDLSEENLSEQFQFEPSIEEFSAREVPTQPYEKFEAPEEEELSEPSTSRPVSSCIDPDYQSEKFYQQPEEEVVYSGPHYRQYLKVTPA